MSKNRTCPTGSFPYTIKSGDTFYKLAMTYNTTVEAIMAINPGVDPKNLQIGQVICIPGGTTPPPSRCPAGTFPYTIKSGDTLYFLAIRYNTTVEAIMRANPGIDPNNLQIGQVICIPGVTPPPPPPPPRCPAGTFSYTIKSGDTIYNLAIRYNTTVEAIMRVNPGIDPNNLQIGQVICIPGGTPPPPTCPIGTFSYTIKPGDTIYNLAITYNTTVEAILSANPGLNPNNLQIGQVICIPMGSPTPPCNGFYYTVKPGDTLYSISAMFNVSVAALMAANPGVDPNNLRIGQVLCIPRGEPIHCPGGTMYTVGPNDNLGTILIRFNISVLDLMDANPNVDLDNLKPGQHLCIMPHMDRGCPCPRSTTKYTIMPSDVPHGSGVVALAQKFNIPVSELMMMNSNLTPSEFVPGKIICVPE